MTRIALQQPASIHFSTQHLPAANRQRALRELFDRAVQLEIETEPGQSVEMTMNQAPGVRRAQMISSLTARMTRPVPMLADGEDTVCLLMKTGGHLAITQGGRQSVPQDGDGVLLVYREAASLEFVNGTYLSVRVPAQALSLAGNIGAAAARRIRSDTEALSLLKAYLANMPNGNADPKLARLYVTHVYDLMSLAIGATEESRHIANQRGVRAARWAAITNHVTRTPEITLDQLAGQHHISPRYVQMLFEEAGTTFSEFALTARLDAARGMLQSPRFASWSIAAISLEAGFGDVSNFNRRFKQRFSATPSDVRARATDEA
jgi:AraC-like DNA-binding protein